MPDPTKYDSEDKWMGACVPTKVDEGKKQEQAVAACLNIWRNKERGEGQGVGGDRQGDGGADKCVCPECGATAEHEKGTPCTDVNCPECGAAMEGEQEKAMSLWRTVKEFFSKEKKEDDSVKDINTFFVYKEQNQWRWFAIYSNKFRDVDKPPEILAEAAHKEFVEAVDKGEWPMPELWLWHIKGTRSGAADYVAYDNSGFSIASGAFDEGKEHVAEKLAEDDDLLTSHGMPMKEIRRDTEDPSIITRYRSIEISPLPKWAAANKHGTGFSILSKEVDMALPEKKRPFLEEKMGKEAVEDLERQLEDKAKELEDQGIEFKEEQEEEAAPEEPKEVEEVSESAVEEPPSYVTHEELEQIFGGYVKPMNELLQGVRDLVEQQGKEIKEQAEVIKGLRQDDETKMKQFLAETPAASLYDRIGSVIGSEEAREDGRTSLAQSKPKEVETPANGPTFVPFVNDMIAKQRGG